MSIKQETSLHARVLRAAEAGHDFVMTF